MNKENNFYKEIEGPNDSLSFSLLRPGGNDTCLIWGNTSNKTSKKEINDLVMNIYSSVEQVGFISTQNSLPRLEMAGGEFCGNATRSAAWLLLNGEAGNVEIEVSGANKPLKAGVDESGNAFAQMPIYEDPSMISQLDDGSYLVKMQGITQLVTNATTEILAMGQEELKNTARQRMAELGIDQDAAAGVMYVSNEPNALRISPVVYVRDIDTLFYETACGSGTTAVGMVLAKTKGESVEIPILQPSGMSITSKIDFNEQFLYAQISGPIAELNTGSIEVSRKYSTEQITKKQQLDSLFINGELTALYNEVFGGPPYFESFTDDEVKEEFNNYFENGFVSVARANGRLIGFEGTTKASTSSIDSLIEARGLDSNKFWYFGDLGVKEEFREKGIGKNLVLQRIKDLSDSVILRTNKNNFRAISLYKSIGFRELPGWQQEVSQTRTDGVVDEDERIFLIKE